MPHQVNFTGQITPDQVAEIAEKGYKTIVNNRPDGEAPDQPTNADIEAAAKQAGLKYKYIPFAGNALTQPIVEEFADYFNDDAEQPILMFCRTGNRSNGLYEAAKKMDLLDD